ncbi:MAG: zinc-ribbon domain-containing protein [Deltaproteobacteria bacterium]|nr:zinc-ribbon domain-containing protein [Deltaproteobacteria bacterium]
MIVHCEGCESGFHVDEHLIKPTGSKVRCSKCRHVFMAYAPPAPADDAEEPLILSDPLSATETVPGPVELSEDDFKLDEAFGEAAGAEPELLDVEDLLADEPPPKEALKASAIGDELDLDLMPAAADDVGDTLPSLDELEIDLSMLEGTAETTEAAPGNDAPQNEIEMDLDLESPALERAETGGAAGSVAEPKPAPEAAVQAGDASSVLLDELDLELEMAETKPATLPKDAGVSAKSLDIDEIDISDLENMLDDLGAPPAGTAPPAAEGIELDQDLEPKAVAPVEVAQATDTLDLNMFAEDLKATGAPDSAVRDDGLDFPLDLEPETGPVQVEVSAEASAEADELDFSDISAMLEHEDKPVAAATDESLEDVDLVIEDMPAAAESGEDLMLDLETLLDEGHGPASAGKPDKATEELDLEVVPAEGLDSTDLEIELEPEAAVPPVHRLPAAAAAQASVAAAARAAVATDNFSTEEFTNVGAPGATSVLEAEPVAEPAAKKKPTAVEPRRAGFRKPLLAVLGVLVLVMAALILPRSLGINIPFLSEMDIDIPFISDLFKSEPEDSAGRLKLALVPEGIAAEFITNSSAGMLCVVKGQVRNNYNQPRSSMRVTVKLYAAGNAVLKTATVFAGNMLSNQELSSLDLIAINARLMNRTGANNMNVGVKPGRTVPFMAVFSNLPASLEEYSVEVADSTP